MLTDERRRILIALSTGLLTACRPGVSSSAKVAGPIRPATGVANEVQVRIDTQQSGRPVNRGVLGYNMQWVDRGDELFDGQGQLKPAMLSMVQQLGPSVLRYPGGAQSDTYHWAKGMGSQAQRGENEHANARAMQRTVVGTREFLELCEATGAQPLITVNIASGTAQEAAAWVRQVNIERLTSSRTGKVLPKVLWWELGNEPYLKMDEQPALAMKPTEFSRRARLFIEAMRAVDPSIKLGLPLTNDTRNGFPITPYPGFTAEVLKTPMTGVDYISVHDAYVPFGMDKDYSDDELYWGAMAGGRSIEADLQNMRAMLAKLMPGKRLPLAITEYNSLFTLGKGRSDELIKSPAGALTVAETLRVLAYAPDVQCANFWSLSGNWFFGAIHSQGFARPVFEVLRLYSEALHGDLLNVQVGAPTVRTPSVGACGAVAALPVLEAVVTRDGATLRVLLIHKDPSNPAKVSLNLGADSIREAQLSVLQADQLFERSDQSGLLKRVDSRVPSSGLITLPPHSAALLTAQLVRMA